MYIYIYIYIYTYIYIYACSEKAGKVNMLRTD